MNTIDELLYYCREPEPVGALLLSGEWGCGKTYLIEHDLKKALSDSAIVLRISLFGMVAPEEIHAAVRLGWMEEYYKIKGIDGIAKKIGKGKKVLAKLDFLPEWLREIATTDTSAFFPIGKEMEGKTVVLVFDDLERCRISSVDVLGVINDYCENRKYHTIIVANQEKIKLQQESVQITGEIQLPATKGDVHNTDESKAIVKLDIPVQKEQGELSYIEIKEKIIQRTVQYLPNYKEIVHAVITGLKYKDTNYKEFVASCEEGLLELFAPDRYDTVKKQSDSMDQEKQTLPHNIRSLKCAINDFYRVYCILRDNDFSDIDNWLYSFTSYLIAYKADIAEDSYYGTLFSDDRVRKLYPAFQEKYTLKSVKQWILHGIWDERVITNEIDIVKRRGRAQTAPEIIKSSRIMDIDDIVLKEGFSDYLKMAYDGCLTLDEYVRLIQNSGWARYYKCTLPLLIDWDKVKEGISKCIGQIKNTLPEGQILFLIIGAEDRSYFTDEEWGAYELISDFALGDKLIFFKNKQLYIDKIRELGSSAFIYIQNKRYEVFDEEMAEATMQAFERENNLGKSHFVSDFNGIWRLIVQSPDIRLEDSLKGFETLKNHLEESLSRISEENRTFSVVHTEQFVENIDKLIRSINKKISECAGIQIS